MQNKELEKKLHKSIVRMFEKRRVYSSFNDNIWGTDLGDMQLINKFNKGFRFLLCVTYIFSKYARVVPLKDKRVLQLLIISKNFWMSLNAKNADPVKYEKIKVVNFIINQGNHRYQIIIQKYIQQMMNLNLLLLKHLLEP